MWGACVSFFRLSFTFGVGLVICPASSACSCSQSLLGSEVSYAGKIVVSDSLLEFMAHIHRNIEMLSAVQDYDLTMWHKSSLVLEIGLLGI